EEEFRAKSEAERAAAERRRKDAEEADRKAREQAHQDKAKGATPAASRDLAWRTLTGPNAAGWAGGFSPDRRPPAAGSVDQATGLWDVARAIPMNRIFEGSGVFGLSYAKDGRLASANVDSTVKLWDPASGRGGPVLRGHSKGVDRVAFSPDGSLLASVSHDG